MHSSNENSKNHTYAGSHLHFNGENRSEFLDKKKKMSVKCLHFMVQLCCDYIPSDLKSILVWLCPVHRRAYHTIVDVFR